MASRPALPIQPLSDRVPIVREDGTPTSYFIRYLQERGLDIDGRVTPQQVQQAIEDWSDQRFVNTNFPLIGGGPLSSDLTLDHGPSGVAPGVYGDATNVPQIVVDVDGHITGVMEVPISGGGGGVAGIWGWSSGAASTSTSASSSKGFIFQIIDPLTIDRIGMNVDGHGAGTPVNYTLSLVQVNNATAPGTITSVIYAGSAQVVNNATGTLNMLQQALPSPVVLSASNVYAVIATASVATARVRHNSLQTVPMVPFFALAYRGYFSSAAVAPAAAYTVGDVLSGMVRAA